MKFGSPDSTGTVIVDCTVLCCVPDSYDDADGLFNISRLLEQQIDKGWAELVDAPGLDTDATLKEAILVNAEGDSLKGTPTDLYYEVARNLIVFSDLKPGEYQLAQLVAGYTLSRNQRLSHYDCEGSAPTNLHEAWAAECTEELEFAFLVTADAASRLSFRIGTGEMKYIGRMKLYDLAQPPYGSKRVVDKDLYNIDGHNVWIESYADRHTQSLTGDFIIDDDPAHEIKALRRLIKKYKSSPWVERWQRRLKALESQTES